MQAGQAIQVRGLTKTYGRGENRVEALSEVDLDIEPGEWVSIIGPSGSGKSTLMNLLGLLDRPTSGSYALNGREVAVSSPGNSRGRGGTSSALYSRATIFCPARAPART